MDIGRAINAPFRDPNWITKALLGGVWELLLVTSPALGGYYLDYVRNVSDGRETPLPEWSDFGRLWVRGLLMYIAWFIYFIPAWILLFIGFLPAMGSDMMSGGAEDALAVVASGTICLMSLIATVYIIAVTIFVQAATVHYALSDDFGAFFRFGEILQRIRSNTGYFTAWIMSLVVYFVIALVAGLIGGVLGWIPCLGQLVSLFVSGAAAFLGLVIAGHLFGQWAAAAYGRPGLGPVPATGGGYGPPSGPSGGGYTPPPGPPTAPPPPPAHTPPAPPAPPTGAPVAPPAPPAPTPPAAAPEEPTGPPPEAPESGGTTEAPEKPSEEDR